MQTTAALAVSCLAVLCLAGCGGDDSKKPGTAADVKQVVEVRSITVVHEPCDEAGKRVEGFDANADGKPDVRKVYDGSGRELCRMTDLNHDGKPDLYEYYGASGETRRREASYVDSGDVTSIEYFEAGKRVRRELDTSGQHRLDTWDYFDPASGKRVKRERDINGDGRIDQWWQWEGEKLTIAIDKSGDGHPDPEATIVVGGSATPGVAPGAPATPSGSATAPLEPQVAPTPFSAPASPTSAVDAGTSKQSEPADAGAASADAGAKKDGGKGK